MNKEKLYSYLSKKKIFDENNEADLSKLAEVKPDESFIKKNGLFKLDKNIGYGQALGVLHNQLFSFNLDDDGDL